MRQPATKLSIFFIMLILIFSITVYFESIFQRKRPHLMDLILHIHDRIIFSERLNHTLSNNTRQPNLLEGHNLTIVSSFWDIGPFQKSKDIIFTPKLYQEWAKVTEYILNPLIIFTDSKNTEILINKLRRDRKRLTKIIYMKDRELWPFKLIAKIQAVFDQPDYPAIHPNTVLAEYSAIQHAKYAAVAEAIRSETFQTEYYAWLDIGYFRDIVNDKKYFILKPPQNHDKNLLAVNEVYTPNLNSTPDEIFRQNIVWVGGGMFLGTRSVQLAFGELYKKAVLYFLEKKIMNTDQQVIYSMYSSEGRRALKPTVELQIYNMEEGPKDVGTSNPWFYLGFLCRQVIGNDIHSLDNKSQLKKRLEETDNKITMVNNSKSYNSGGTT